MSSEIIVKARIDGSDHVVRVPVQYIDKVKPLQGGNVKVFVGTKDYVVDHKEWTNINKLVQKFNGGF